MVSLLDGFLMVSLDGFLVPDHNLLDHSFESEVQKGMMVRGRLLEDACPRTLVDDGRFISVGEVQVAIDR
jgi:hypothetical protein